jgi:hypothetical protein
VFWGLQGNPDAEAALRALVAAAYAIGDPAGPWFIADNLITFGHARGFLADPRFVEAVLAEQPSQVERAIAWRTHTLCGAAESCLSVVGDYMECGAHEGYSMAVVMRYPGGPTGRQCWLYVPDALDATEPPCIAFVHIDMNNPVAKRGALEALFDRISRGGTILFDDYGWTGYREQKGVADAFMREHELAVLELPTGQGLVEKR